MLLRRERQKIWSESRATRAPKGRLQVISHPDRQFYALTHGVISRYHTHHSSRGLASRMAITADFARGSSGAPVFNETGDVAGMVCSTHSIYYENKDGEKKNLQMVLKECIPARSILALFGGSNE